MELGNWKEARFNADLLTEAAFVLSADETRLTN